MSIGRDLYDGLVSQGLLKEAQEAYLIFKFAEDMPIFNRWLRRQYDKMRTRHMKGKEPQDAKKKLDDILRRKESGPPEERVYFWYCRQSKGACPACRARHGRLRTLRQWRQEGLPGPQVCQKRDCGCLLLPLRPEGMAPEGVAQFGADDGDMAAGLIGLREDNSLESMNQGFALMPFWSNYGAL